MPLKKSYVALAWTRPVPWAGFDRLSSDIDAAAKQSRTIRYQRDLIRRYVREVQGVLEKKVALLELAPNRETLESLKSLESLVHECSSQATFLSVDFTAAQGWRPQPALRQGMAAEGKSACAVPAGAQSGCPAGSGRAGESVMAEEGRSAECPGSADPWRQALDCRQSPEAAEISKIEDFSTA